MHNPVETVYSCRDLFGTSLQWGVVQTGQNWVLYLKAKVSRNRMNMLSCNHLFSIYFSFRILVTICHFTQRHSTEIVLLDKSFHIAMFLEFLIWKFKTNKHDNRRKSSYVKLRCSFAICNEYKVFLDCSTNDDITKNLYNRVHRLHTLIPKKTKRMKWRNR